MVLWLLMSQYTIFSGFFLSQTWSAAVPIWSIQSEHQSTQYLSNANSQETQHYPIWQQFYSMPTSYTSSSTHNQVWINKNNTKRPTVLRLLEKEDQPPHRTPFLFKIDSRPNLWRTTKAAYHNPWAQIVLKACSFLSAILKRALRSKRAERSTPLEHRPVALELAIQKRGLSDILKSSQH